MPVERHHGVAHLDARQVRGRRVLGDTGLGAGLLRAVRGQDVIAVESLYRRWYGYPAQSLLVATLPLDVAIDVVVLGGVLVSMPVVYGVRALRGGEAVESEKSLRGSPPSDGAGR